MDDEAAFVAWLGVAMLSGAAPYGHGLSATNLLRVALGGEDSGSRPWDIGDAGCCERMMDAAPPTLRVRMRAVYATWGVPRGRCYAPRCPGPVVRGVGSCANELRCQVCGMAWTGNADEAAGAVPSGCERNAVVPFAEPKRGEP